MRSNKISRVGSHCILILNRVKLSWSNSFDLTLIRVCRAIIIVLLVVGTSKHWLVAVFHILGLVGLVSPGLLLLVCDLLQAIDVRIEVSTSIVGRVVVV